MFYIKSLESQDKRFRYHILYVTFAGDKSKIIEVKFRQKIDIYMTDTAWP